MHSIKLSSNLSVLSPKTRFQQLLTKQRLCAVFFVQLNEAYQITVILPMVVFMVRDFGINPQHLSIYTSILNATFCFCQFLCCYSWGLLSDKYGRRIALLSGLIFSAVAIIMFGMSKSFITAMIARSIGGFFNGNLGVIKAYLSDITDASNRAWAFSVLAIAYGFGSVMGSICGGIFIETHDINIADATYTPTVGIIKWWIFDTEYPFLIPCAIGAMISLIAFVLTLIFIHDVLHLHAILANYHNSQNLHSGRSTNTKDNDYNSTLSEDYMMATLDSELSQLHPNRTYSVDMVAKQAIFETCPGDGIHSMEIVQYSLRSNASSMKPSHHSNEFQALLMNKMNKLKRGKGMDQRSSVYSFGTLHSLIWETDLHHALVIWTLNIMAIMMFQEMNPVYMAQALEFTSQFIGFTMAFSGFCLLVFTYFVQPYFLTHFRFRTMCIVCCVAMCFVILHMPSIFTSINEIGFISKSTSTTHTVSLGLAFLNSMAAPCFASISIICSMCWVNNSVPSNCVGRANGFAQSTACLVRAIGPGLTGLIWSQSVLNIDSNVVSVYFAYLPSFVCYLVIQVWICVYIGDDAQLMWEQRFLNKNKANTMLSEI
eukprot:149925_1